MTKSKIKIVLPRDLWVKICQAQKQDETFDETIERYVKKGMQIEGAI